MHGSLTLHAMLRKRAHQLGYSNPAFRGVIDPAASTRKPGESASLKLVPRVMQNTPHHKTTHPP